MIADTKDYAVHVIGPGFQLVLRVPGFTGIAGVRDHFADLLTAGGVFKGDKDVVRFGPGMYCSVLSEWAEHEQKQLAAQQKQQELEALQRAAMARSGLVGAGPGAPGTRIMRGR